VAWAGRHARGELRSRWAVGECLRRGGRAADAKARLLELEPRLVEVGHAPLLARTRQALRRLGVRRAAPRQSVQGSRLTVREREILQLSGTGLRDREIATRLGISRWAVVRSAESATAKLGAASRNQAIVAVLTS
jgi:DNA-binding CsgD family transcriptional regulator